MMPSRSILEALDCVADYELQNAVRQLMQLIEPAARFCAYQLERQGASVPGGDALTALGDEDAPLSLAALKVVRGGCCCLCLCNGCVVCAHAMDAFEGLLLLGYAHRLQQSTAEKNSTQRIQNPTNNVHTHATHHPPPPTQAGLKNATLTPSSSGAPTAATASLTWRGTVYPAYRDKVLERVSATSQARAALDACMDADDAVDARVAAYDALIRAYHHLVIVIHKELQSATST